MPPVCFNPYQATRHDKHGTETDLLIALLFPVKHLVLLIYHFLRILCLDPIEWFVVYFFQYYNSINNYTYMNFFFTDELPLERSLSKVMHWVMHNNGWWELQQCRCIIHSYFGTDDNAETPCASSVRIGSGTLRMKYFNHIESHVSRIAYVTHINVCNIMQGDFRAAGPIDRILREHRPRDCWILVGSFR